MLYPVNLNTPRSRNWILLAQTIATQISTELAPYSVDSAHHKCDFIWRKFPGEGNEISGANPNSNQHWHLFYWTQIFSEVVVHIRKKRASEGEILSVKEGLTSTEY